MLASAGSNLVTFGLLIALLSSGVALIWWARVHFRGHEENHNGFTLQELRELYNEGKLSEIEYRTARKIILGTTENRRKSDLINESTKNLSGQQRMNKPPDKLRDNLEREECGG